MTYRYQTNRYVPEPERRWRCPGCDYQVRAVRRPDACRDHPFDEMQKIEEDQ